ncbi:S8 family serine peptidase [Hymenobacter sp. BT491]|uniref:S8 family serine peptidase n=1 Tax=Hymenobacter sp. BT491 TaxID=2766779 RepID=UPI001653E824|nr:S8 family serine peptidase [Hymenobacter sp. BT491]MBC6990700.1 S8 family serine peptidase [Hymenobacter sp. BT491]
MAPSLHNALSEKGLQSVRVSVQDAASFRQWLREHLPTAEVTQPASSKGVLALSKLSPAQVQQLAVCPLVEFVDVPNRRAHEESQQNKSDLSLNKITVVHSRFPQMAGQGMTVSVKEGQFDAADIDFKGRVLNANQFSGPPSAHATAMATFMAGGGNSAPTGLGVAWKAQLATSDFAQLLPDDAQQLLRTGVSVQNHSYGVAIENYYGLEAREYDRSTWQNPTLLHVFSSGNDGDKASPDGPYRGIANVANLTGQFKMSKNTLSVGATGATGQVSPLSSRGPAYDGRIKPEIVAYGDGGTSDAAALVSGVSLLVQQAYQQQHSGALPPAALVKAVLLNSADDAGRPEVDFEYGFGQTNALGAVRTVADNRFFTDALTQGSDKVFPVTVPPGARQLKVTLAWHDPEAAANAAQALVNDLDLELVQTSTSAHWKPWVLSTYPHADSLMLPARRGPDHLNNVEQITVAVPEAGQYEVHVRGYRVATGPAQPFSVAYETSSGFEWVTPLQETAIRPGAATLLRWQWSGLATTGHLEYQTVGSSTWRLVNANVGLAQGYYSWTAPDTAQVAQVRLLIDGVAYPSESFLIALPLALQVGYACADEALLYWRRVPEASGYQVYKMGANSLEPVVLATDTTLVINRSQSPALQYAVAPVWQGREGARSITIDYTLQGTGCYVRNFLPRQAVTDTVLLDLEIGSLYQLQALRLEKRINGTYQPIQTITPVTQLRMALTDPAPNPGQNMYRVQLVTADRRTYYSQPEAVQFVPTNDVQVYPNPVAAGQPLSIINGEDTPVHLRLYDSMGRLRRAATDNGVTKTFDTSGLAKGLYFLQVRTKAGRQTTRRVVIL